MFYTLAIVILCIIAIPLCCITAVAIVFTSGFPVLFHQKRIGKNGISFVMYKFRSMRVGAEKEQKSLFSKNESDGPVFKIARDPRFTVLGKFLAHTGLDELPQLYNVLQGDMALFGPRPLPVAEAARLKPWQQKRHAMKPGILSPAILTGHYHEDFDAWMRSDVAYVKEKSFVYDFYLTLRTLRFLVSLLLHELLHPRLRVPSS